MLGFRARGIEQIIEPKHQNDSRDGLQQGRQANDPKATFEAVFVGEDIARDDDFAVTGANGMNDAIEKSDEDQAGIGNNRVTLAQRFKIRKNAIVKDTLAIAERLNYFGGEHDSVTFSEK